MVLHAMNDDRLGPYRLLRRLGEGGMGVVHLAVDPQGRQVAVKVLRGEVAGDEVARRRLSREVETMRRVRSKFIAEVVDADVTGHRPYIVTRYVPGRPLDEIVKDDGPLDLPALVRLAHGVASALAVVHSVGVIHRDLKPGNVLILDGEPVLIDFGIAQAVDATRLTQTGMFIGTPGYLAPEIIEGQEAGPEVDIHAWAGTLLYAATGQPPFGKGTLEMIFYNITAGKADISGVPAELQPLLKAGFQRNPAKRPKAADLAEQTARMLPRPPRGVPDEISTVPRPDAPDDFPTRRPPFVGEKPSYDVSTPPMTPRRLIDGQEQPVAPPADPHFVSLLPNQAAGLPNQAAPLPGAGLPGAGLPEPGAAPADQGAGDPWPTRRVSPEELRQIQREAGPSQPWPQQQPPLHPQPQSQPQPLPQSQSLPQVNPHEADVPTRRVRPDSAEFGRLSSGPQPVDHGRLGSGAQPLDHGRFNAGQEAANYGPVPVQPPPYIPAQPQYPPQEPQAAREPYNQGGRPAQALQRSKAYGVASAMLLILMIVAAVTAPVLVAVVAIPIAVLLRAADLAQPVLSGRRPAGSAALDVLRVFAQPQALAKSVGITVALVLYALILGLPVTLLLSVVVRMNSANALAWGAAVALWTLCAGPGVEGPGRQMRRTLSSLVPSRTAAMAMAGVLAAGAALSLILAYGTFGDTPRGSVWSPLDVTPVTEQLSSLKGGG
ncbi:serine/threonine-protein kinase [Nonomuraea sp. NPDC049637]|uniref:serine/threonine-protein kinase n=1 Tax=Nonomuraea sp. NPDC049637 TaxID=3154356 RepID=UPI00341D5684